MKENKLSRFNKYLILRWFAEQSKEDLNQIRMTQMIDYKKITKEYNSNLKLLNRYFHYKNINQEDEIRKLLLKNDIYFC